MTHQKNIDPKTGFLNRNCIDCGKTLARHGSLRCVPCFGKQKSLMQIGSKNHNYIDGKWSGRAKDKNARYGNPCLDCGKILRQKKTKRCHNCDNKLRRERSLGEKNGNFSGGAMRYPYPLRFDTHLKEAIRKRDGHKCMECGVPQMECVEKLSVHHIDGNKNNLDINNLISLCRKCHLRLRWHPEGYEKKYREMIQC